MQVLVRWACDKVSSAAASLPDEELLEALQVGCWSGICSCEAQQAGCWKSLAVQHLPFARPRQPMPLQITLLACCCRQAKLAGQWGVQYAAVAAHAASQGRQRLAALLLDHERCAAEQVPLLLELGELACGSHGRASTRDG